MSGEGVIPNRSPIHANGGPAANDPAAVARTVTDGGAGAALNPTDSRSARLLRRIASRLLPHWLAVPAVVAIAAQGFTDEQLQEIDRRIVTALRAHREAGGQLARRRIA